MTGCLTLIAATCRGVSPSLFLLCTENPQDRRKATTCGGGSQQSVYCRVNFKISFCLMLCNKGTIKMVTFCAAAIFRNSGTHLRAGEEVDAVVLKEGVGPYNQRAGAGSCADAGASTKSDVVQDAKVQLQVQVKVDVQMHLYLTAEVAATARWRIESPD